jgi:sugar phosphate permease
MSVPAALSSARWRRLIPLAFVTYSFAYIDRSNYSLGAAGGLKQALHITSSESGLLGGLFFIGYFIFQVPAATFAERRSVKQLMFWSLLCWGVLAAAQGVIPWVWLFLVDRFLLGVVEAAAIPAMLVFLTHWFSESERGRADTFLILGNPVTLLWMSVVSGYLIAATSYHWMFVIEGLPAIAWAFVFRALATDRPADAAWLNAAERDAITSRLSEEQADIPKVAGYWGSSD